MSDFGNDLELGLNNEGENGIDAQLRLNFQERREAPAQDPNGVQRQLNVRNRREATAQDANGAQRQLKVRNHRETPVRRMSWSEMVLLALAITWGFFSDLSISLLVGLNVFVLSGTFFIFLQILLAISLPCSPVYAPTPMRIAWIIAFLFHIAQALKMKLPS